MKGGISVRVTAAGIKKALQKLVHMIRSSGKRQKLTMLSAVFVLYILLLSGIFSYFHSEDAVSNRLEAKNGSVTIQEPNWDSKGQYKAQASEPGMTIEKDPSGYNNGQANLFIRLTMTIQIDDLENCRLSEPPLFSQRLDAIANAIQLGSKDANDENIHLFDTEGDELICNNSNFVFGGYEDSSDKKERVYYFYYTGGDKQNEIDMMRVVNPTNSTAELFCQLEIPVYKKDYLGYFDQPYDIILTAEGIPAANYPDGLPVEDIKDAQDNVITQGAVSIFTAESH